MFNLKNFIGKEVSFRMNPWHAGKFRGILAGYDKDHLYIYQYQNVIDLIRRATESKQNGRWRYVKDENEQLVYRYKWKDTPAKIIQKVIINRHMLIHMCLAEEEPWYEEHKLENPYFLDQWLRRGERKKKQEQYLQQRDLKMVNFKKTIGLTAVTVFLGVVAAIACYLPLAANLQ